MKVNLNIQERYSLFHILPEKGDFATMKTVEELRQILLPSDEEVEKYNIVEDESAGQIRWNDDGIKPIDLEFKKVSVDYLKTIFAEKSKQGNLTFPLFLLSVKFGYTEKE